MGMRSNTQAKKLEKIPSMPPPRQTWESVETRYSTARSKAHSTQTAAALEKKSLAFPTGRMREKRMVWSTCSPTYRSPAAMIAMSGRKISSTNGMLEDISPPRIASRDTPPSVR